MKNSWANLKWETITKIMLKSKLNSSSSKKPTSFSFKCTTPFAKRFPRNRPDFYQCSRNQNRNEAEWPLLSLGILPRSFRCPLNLWKIDSLSLRKIDLSFRSGLVERPEHKDQPLRSTLMVSTRVSLSMQMSEPVLPTLLLNLWVIKLKTKEATAGITSPGQMNGKRLRICVICWARTSIFYLLLIAQRRTTEQRTRWA